MKDGMEYAEMLGLTVSSCDLTIKPAKKRRKKDSLKEDVIAKVNEESVREDLIENEQKENLDDYEELSPTKTKKGLKLDVLQIQGIAIFALIVTILLTNIFWQNSGMNRLFNAVFSTEVEQVDARNYLSFNAKSPSNDMEVSLDGGVMTFSGKGALYPVCDGEVFSIVQEDDGKYTMTINHSDTFKTVISGADFVYTEKGEEVFGYIPVCYISDGKASVYMYDEDVLLTNYVVEDGAIIWES